MVPPRHRPRQALPPSHARLCARPAGLTDRIVRSQADQAQLSEEQIESFKEAFLVFVSPTPIAIFPGLIVKVVLLLTVRSICPRCRIRMAMVSL